MWPCSLTRIAGEWHTVAFWSVFIHDYRSYTLVLCRDTRPVSSRLDFLVQFHDFPIGIESEGNGRDENL